MSRLFVVRDGVPHDRSEVQPFWHGTAEDAIEAAVMAVIHGPFSFDAATLRIFDDRGDVWLVDRAQRDWRLEQLRARLEQPPSPAGG